MKTEENASGSELNESNFNEVQPIEGIPNIEKLVEERVNQLDINKIIQKRIEKGIEDKLKVYKEQTEERISLYQEFLYKTSIEINQLHYRIKEFDSTLPKIDSLDIKKTITTTTTTEKKVKVSSIKDSEIIEKFKELKNPSEVASFYNVGYQSIRKRLIKLDLIKVEPKPKK